MMNLRSPVFRFRGALKSLTNPQPIMKEILDQTALMPGSTNYGWSQTGDMLNFRSTFDDVDRMLDHVTRITPMFDRLLSNSTGFDRFEFKSPIDNISRIMDVTEGLLSTSPNTQRAQYFETEDNDDAHGYFRRLPNISNIDPETEVSIKPNFEIKDWNITKSLLNEMLERVSNDPDCSFFSWNKHGNELKSRASFKTGEALSKHIEQIKMIFNSLNAGPAKLNTLEFYGPNSELNKIKEIASEYQPKYFETKLSSSSINQIDDKKQNIGLSEGEGVITDTPPTK